MKMANGLLPTTTVNRMLWLEPMLTAVVMVTPRPMLDLDRYAEQLRERRVSANAVVVESPDGIVVADVADVVSFLASDAGRLISGQNLPLRARVA